MDAEALAKILNCSVPDPSYTTLIGRQKLSKRCDPELIEAAKRLAHSIERRIPEWEQMKAKELLAHGDDVLAVCSALEPVVLFEPYLDPRDFITSWGAVLAAMPEDGYQRISKLGTKVATLRMAQPYMKAERAANIRRGRWGKRTPVIEWLAAERRANPEGDAGAWLGKEHVLEEVRRRTKEAGVKLSGEKASVVRTCKDWLKLAGVR